MAGTLAWERAGNQFFRNVEGPAMRWNIKPCQYHVRGGICGGIIAVWYREDVVIKHTQQTAKTNHARNANQLLLYDAEGVLFNSITLDFGSVVDVLITSAETVVVLTKSGIARHYTDLGMNFTQIRLPFELKRGVLSSDGYVVQSLGPDFVLGFVTNLDEPRYHVVELSSHDVTNWSIIPSDKSLDRPAQFILLISASSKGVAPSKSVAYLYDLSLSDASKQKVRDEVYSQDLKVSPTGKMVSFSDGSHLQVFESDFTDESSTCFNGEVPLHSNMFWVGDEALALVSQDGEAEIVSLRGESACTTTYFEEDELALLTEPDGLRILGRHHHSLYQPVYRATSEIFKLGSLAPSAILYSCIDQMDAGSPRSDQTVRVLEPAMLVRAIETCIDASTLELEPKVQKRLMRAAAFGKSVAEIYDSSRYLQTLTRLRIGNAVRTFPDHPLFVTQHQLDKLGVPLLLVRLQQRKLWAEAVNVAELEHYPVEPVYIEWACHTIQNNDELDDAALFELLQTKMSKLGPHSHSAMALKSIEQGRQSLALTLLEHEPIAQDRVRLLMETHMTQASLEQATRCGDPYLLDYVLMVLKEQLTLPQLMRLIGTNKMAIDRQQLLVQLDEPSEQHLHEFLYHMDLRTRSLQLEYSKTSELIALGESSADDIDQQKQVQSLRALEKKFSTLNKSLIPDSRVCAEWADMLNLQKQLEQDYQLQFVGSSASQTIATLLKIPQVNQAQKLKSKLGISDRQFWWLRIRALVERREFDVLWDFGQSRKSPIGYLPFYETCYEAGNLDAAARFVELISEFSIEEKIKMYVKVKHIDVAKELASKSRDTNLVAMVAAL